MMVENNLGVFFRLWIAILETVKYANGEFELWLGTIELNMALSGLIHCLVWLLVDDMMGGWGSKQQKEWDIGH